MHTFFLHLFSFSTILIFWWQLGKRPCRPASPISRLKKKSRVSNRDVSGLMDAGSYMCEARSWSDTPPCVVDSRRDVATVSATGENGEVGASYQGNWLEVGSWLSGKPARGGHAPQHPFDKLSQWRCSDLVWAGAWDKYVEGQLYE